VLHYSPYNHYIADASGLPWYAVRACGPWYYGTNGWDDYAARNGIGCTPGTLTKGGDDSSGGLLLASPRNRAERLIGSSNVVGLRRVTTDLRRPCLRPAFIYPTKGIVRQQGAPVERSLCAKHKNVGL
jgi:hypothetical protein